LGSSAGAAALETGAWTGAGASTAGAGAGASSFFLQPAAKTVARASTRVREISFFIRHLIFLNLPFERKAHGFKIDIEVYSDRYYSQVFFQFFFMAAVYDVHIA
jgi:hypothetical protein